MAARRFRTLTDSEMASITGRRAAGRTAWRNHPSAGAVVACCGEDFVVLPGVFPPRAASVGLEGSVLADQAMQEDDPRVCYVISFSRG